MEKIYHICRLFRTWLISVTKSLHIWYIFSIFIFCYHYQFVYLDFSVFQLVSTNCFSIFYKSLLFYSSGACQCATFIWFRKNAENGFFQNIFLSINFLNTSYISSCREQNSLQEYVYNMS